MFTPRWAALPVLVVITIIDGTDIICNGGFLSANYIAKEIVAKNCNYINNSLIIANLTVKPPNIGELRRIRRIEGSLKIRNTSKLGYISSLSELQSIGNSNLTEPALQIHDNDGLTRIHFDSLVSLLTWDEHDVFIEHNPDLDPHINVLLTSITHPDRIRSDIATSDTQKSDFIHVSHALVIVTTFSIIAAVMIGIVIGLLRRQYNKHIEKRIYQPLLIIEDIQLDDEQKNRLRQYAREVLQMTAADWKNYCDHVIRQPVKDPTYHRKPAKNLLERSAEAQLKYMNIPFKKKRNRAHMAKLPDDLRKVTRYISERMRQAHINKEQHAAFSIFTRTLDADNNLMWSGDIYAGYNKIFIGNTEGKIIRREIPSKKDERRIFTRQENDIQLKTICKEIYYSTRELITFIVTVRRERIESTRHSLPPHTFNTTCHFYNGWPDNGFPKDMKAVMRLMWSITLNHRRSTILIGKSTDASCELFWMMHVVTKAILGRATFAHLVPILEACIILLKPEYLTSCHFLYLLRFVVGLAAIAGVLTNEERESAKEWRDGYFVEEMKSDARIYGRPYLRVIDLEQVDVECDEVLAELNRTFAASSTSSKLTHSEPKKDKSKTPAQVSPITKPVLYMSPPSSSLESEKKQKLKASTKSKTPKTSAATPSPPSLNEIRLENDTQFSENDALIQKDVNNYEKS